MSVSTTYLLNVALHGAVLSIFAMGVLALLRRPGRRSFVAISGLLAVGVLPWMTALRPERRGGKPVAEVQAQPVSPALPLWTVVTLPMPQEKPVVVPSEPVANTASFVFPDPLTCVVSVWAAGTAAGMILLAWALLKVGFWKRSLRPLDDKAWDTLTSLSPDIPARHLFFLSESTTSPCVTGFFRPRIVLPGFLLKKGAEQELRWALGHEIAHLRAGDSRWVIVFSLIRCVNWWNPLVHRLVSQWADAREQLCDLHATGLSEDRSDYGKFLIDMARRIAGRPPLAVAMAKRTHAGRLKQRIVCLLGSGADSMQPVGKAFVGFGSALFVTSAVFVSALRIGAEETKDLPISTADAEPAKEQTVPAPDPSAETSPATTLPKPPEARSSVKWTSQSQLKFSAKMLATPTKPAFKDGTLLSDGQVQLYMRSVSQTKGVDLMTAPSVTARFGESVKIEIINHVVPKPGRQDPAKPVPFVGISFSMLGKPAGNQMDLKFDADYRFVSGKPISHFSRKEAAKLDPDAIKIVQHSVASRMNPGQTVVCDLGEIEPGRFLQILVNAVPIDRDGRPVDAFVNGKPVDLPDDSVRRSGAGNTETPPQDMSSLKNTRGKLRLNAVVIDIPRDPKLREDQRYFKKLSPAADDSLNALVAHYGLEKRPLKEVVIPLKGPTVPWPEHPEIRLSAVASPDLSIFVLTNDSEKNGKSSISHMDSGHMVHIDVQSGNPAIERRVYLTVFAER